ncbi:hypothetical protein [Natrinema sp. 1APR25-10V2]|uniref:hypothetical protein n=1 Tax=Natrinema sp. 1APR25-10V2 TaxID=2951081 RepID=UPI0028747D6E|nr:hypothetical protein [Natrinema sp. 1APR25-10V2]MDS0475536.1 hypothetical protein [Natrinema sp. 1APR25-10V2]
MVNAFWLDRDLERAAAWLVDRHVTSSVFECSMVLTTAVQQNGYPESADLYFTHPDNPLTRWAARSAANWQYLREYTAAAHEEWRYRWDHDPTERHGCWATVRSLDDAAVVDLEWPAEGRTDPPQLTGEWTTDDYVDAYRYYYANDKRHLFGWAKDRSMPPWIDEYTVDEAANTAVDDVG